MSLSGINTNFYNMFYSTNKVSTRQKKESQVQNENFSTSQSQEALVEQKKSGESYDLQSMMERFGLKSAEFAEKIRNEKYTKAYQPGGKTSTEKEWVPLLTKTDDSIDVKKENAAVESKDKPSDRMIICTKDGTPLTEKALTDKRYTDKETGFSWYAGEDGRPYMIGEDAENFYELCKKNGEFPLKKFAEMTGTIQKLDDNTTAFVGDNGIAIKGRDGSEYVIDITGMSYDAIMDMLSKASGGGDYYSDSYWNHIKSQL